MNEPQSHKQIEHLHSVYEAITQRRMPLRWGGDAPHLWLAWMNQGFTEADLRRVVAYRWVGYHNGKRNIGCFKLERLIGDTMAFADDLAECQALDEMRKKPRPNPARESILAQTGHEGETAKVRTAEEILRDQEFFNKCKRDAGLI